MPIAIPGSSLLGAYARSTAFTDCYAITVPTRVTLPSFILAFYTTRLFKLERWILAHAARRPSTDEQVLSLAQSTQERFAIWKVENRNSDEILLAAGATRSWLCVRHSDAGVPSTSLLFGSAVVPTREDGRFDLAFHALLGFHRQYSKMLLAAAAKRLRSTLGA